jgi:hypothetical protein
MVRIGTPVKQEPGHVPIPGIDCINERRVTVILFSFEVSARCQEHLCELTLALDSYPVQGP